MNKKNIETEFDKFSFDKYSPITDATASQSAEYNTPETKDQDDKVIEKLSLEYKKTIINIIAYMAKYDEPNHDFCTIKNILYADGRKTCKVKFYPLFDTQPTVYKVNYKKRFLKKQAAIALKHGKIEVPKF
jgi:hypothetical protein